MDLPYILCFHSALHTHISFVSPPQLVFFFNFCISRLDIWTDINAAITSIVLNESRRFTHTVTVTIVNSTRSDVETAQFQS